MYVENLVIAFFPTIKIWFNYWRYTVGCPQFRKDEENKLPQM